MSANAPWSVKGIDAKAREVAKALARQSGMTLGEWLNQMILEGQDVGDVIMREKARLESGSEPRSSADKVMPGSGQRPAEIHTSRPTRPQPRRDYDDHVDSEDYGQAAYEDHEADYSGYEYQSARPAPVTPSYGVRNDHRPFYGSRPHATTGRSLPLTPPLGEPLARPNSPASGQADMGRVVRVLDALSERLETSEARSTQAVHGVSSAVEQILSRLELNESMVVQTETRLGEKLAFVGERMGEWEQARLRLDRTEEDQSLLAHRLHEAERLLDAQAERLDGLSVSLKDEREKVMVLEAQVQSAPPRQTFEVMEQTLGKLANQIYENETRTRETIRELREELMHQGHRLAQTEGKDQEALIQVAFDKLVLRFNERLDEVDSRHRQSLKSFELALSSLDGRVTQTEGSGDVTDADAYQKARLDSEALSRKIDETRAELFGLFNQAPKIDSSVIDVVAESEKRQMQRLEQLGQDVIRAAKLLNEETERKAVKAQEQIRQWVDKDVVGRSERLEQRLDQKLTKIEAEQKNTQSLVQQDMVRFSQLLDQKMGQSDLGHSQALERLSTEIARITERVNARLSEADQRLDLSLNETSRGFELKADALRNDLQNRLAETEARTLKKLEETHARIEKQIAKSQTEVLLTETIIAQAKRKISDDNGVGFQRAPAPAPVVYAAEPYKPYESNNQGGVTDEDSQLEYSAGSRAAAPSYDEFRSDLDTPLYTKSAPVLDESYDPDDPFAGIDQSRRASPAPVSQAYEPKAFIEEDEETASGVSLSTREALAQARAAVRASLERDHEDLRPHVKTRVPRETSDSRDKGSGGKILKASGLAALIVTAGVGGYIGLRDPINTVFKPKPEIADDQVLTVRTTKPAIDIELQADYAEAVQALEARSADSIDKLRQVASKGHVQAQFRLGKLYEGHEKRVTPDKAEARLWYQRASEGGVAQAMYNLAILYHHGEGGPQDRALALMWFRKAAERGILDAQFNLGALYQTGEEGVLPANPTESYKWFKIAAKSGDAEAIKLAEDIGAKLTENQRIKADAEIAAFMPVSEGIPTLNMAEGGGSEGSAPPATTAIN